MRLKKASPQEILHRLKEKFVILRARFFKANILKNECLQCKKNPNESVINLYIGFLSNVDFNVSSEQLNDILKNKIVEFYGSKWNFLTEEKWFKCPIDGYEWPKIFFQSIDYGDTGHDVRIIWEPSRLQFLNILGDAYSRSEDKKVEIFDNYKEIVRSWRKANPPYVGPHYISTMECALRIISLTTSQSFFYNENKDDPIWHDISGIVTTHAQIIYERMSLFSSTGNHTLAEASGLIFASKFYQDHQFSEKWYKRGKKYFVSEFMDQTFKDGGSKEQSSHYLKFVFDLASVTMPLLEDEDKKNLSQRLKKIKYFLELINQDNYAYGDSDDGYAFSPNVSFLNNMQEGEIKPIEIFEDTGILRIKKNNLCLYFNFSNLGLGPLYAHGHSDCLSITLKYGNEEILTDRGTYSYSLNKRLRRYFRSTKAHNTMEINIADQSQQLSSFLWESDYSSEIHSLKVTDKFIAILASHDGYYKKHKCIHWRGIYIDHNDSVIIYDLAKENSKNARTCWNFHPLVKIKSLKQNCFQINENILMDFNGLPESNTVHHSPSYAIYQKAKSLYIDSEKGESLVSFHLKKNQVNIEKVKNYFKKMLNHD